VQKIRHSLSGNFRTFSEHFARCLLQLVMIRSHEESGASNLRRGIGENPKAAARRWPFGFATPMEKEAGLPTFSRFIAAST
jgi:hypothetical protein